MCHGDVLPFWLRCPPAILDNTSWQNASKNRHVSNNARNNALRLTRLKISRCWPTDGRSYVKYKRHVRQPGCEKLTMRAHSFDLILGNIVYKVVGPTGPLITIIKGCSSAMSCKQFISTLNQKRGEESQRLRANEPKSLERKASVCWCSYWGLQGLLSGSSEVLSMNSVVWHAAFISSKQRLHLDAGSLLARQFVL